MKIYTNYKITNLIDGKVYIGYHYGTEDDSYLCSSGNPHFWNAIMKYEPGCEGLSINKIKKFYAKNRFINFKKETIQYFDDEESMYEGEKYWIEFYRNLLGKENVYNLLPGGEGGWDYVNELLENDKQKSHDRAVKASKTAFENSTHPFLGFTHEFLSEKAYDQAIKELENGTHPFQNLTTEQLSDRARKTARTRLDLGNHSWQNQSHDQRVENTRKANETLGPEGRSERSKKAVKTQFENGTHPFQNITPEQRIDINAKLSIAAKNRLERDGDHLNDRTYEQRVESSRKAMKTMGDEGLKKKSRKAMATMGPEGLSNRAKKIAENRKIKRVFYNSDTNKYKVSDLYWKSRKKLGFTTQLCKLSDWPQYCLDHNLDPTLINN